MFGRPKNELALPKSITASSATEVLRVWSEPNGPQYCVVKTTWEDPASWGLLLADAARHAAKAYANEGLNEQEALARIVALFRAEMESPTDTPVQLD